MNNEILAAKALITLGVSGATSLSVTPPLLAQLNTLYPFLYLSLPLWYFFILMLLVATLGSFFALLTDVVEDEPNTLKKLALAFGLGVTTSFIILPSIIAAPSMGTLLLTSLVASFSGSIILIVLAQVLRDKTLQIAIKTSISKSILYGFSKLEGLIDYLTGGPKK